MCKPVNVAIKNSKYVMRMNRVQILQDILNVPEKILSNFSMHPQQSIYVNQNVNGEMVHYLIIMSKTMIVMKPRFT